ncbi:class II fructose-bisphosphate aldolase [Alteribacillus sp. YIM 98480]|uniref:class II fructose-bisphosphate aldolase n=1 Tax=Alteribacillus sp. YIM 98480 TaxID=2606599 RepID=UPI00131E5384|nr:class II fructose-bisphosphate aldolase [Alteribacillus sp. YIM 98480]
MLVSMGEMLRKAHKEHYAVANFDIWNSEMLFGVMNAVEKTESPVILAFGSGFTANTDIYYYAKMMVERAKKSDMPVAVHWDHGKNMEVISYALDCGFNSIMIDASGEEFEENVRITKEVVDKCKMLGVPVEAELGHIGPETKYEDLLSQYKYTDPDMAAEFVERTGVDILATAIGNAHGVYTSEPQINLDILKKVSEKVEVPLVLHGASGISDDIVKKSIDMGVAKINIHTDLCLAAMDVINNNDKPYLKLQQEVTAAIEKRAEEKIKLFGSNGKGRNPFQPASENASV